jgi:hypothetical protein
MKDYRVQYKTADGKVRVTRVAYTEDGANDRADELELMGYVRVIDILECTPGVFPSEAES